MLRRRTALCAALLVAAAPAVRGQAAAPVAGHVDLVNGTVTLVGADGRARSVSAGSDLRVGDTVVTQRDSELHAIMVDGTVLAVHPLSQVRVTAYASTGRADDRAWFQLIKGGLRTISGWMLKARPPAFRVVTDAASVGIRGTDLEVFHLGADASSSDEGGTHVIVHQGQVHLDSTSVRLELGPGDAGWVPGSGVAPRRQAAPPAYLQARRGASEAALLRRREQNRELMELKLREAGLWRETESLEQHLERLGR